MRKNNRDICFLKNIKNRDPILAGRFHTNFSTVIFSKPVRQFLQSFRKRRETSLLIISSAVCIGNTDTSINPGFVDIKSTAIKTDSDWSSSKIESTLEEISLRATVMRHSLMP